MAAALEIQKATASRRSPTARCITPCSDGTSNATSRPMMQRYGLGMTVWSPLASGFLSGKYTRETLSEPGNRYAGFDILPFDKEHGFAVVERLRAIAMRHDSSVAQAALAWLPARPSVTSVLVGSSKLAQLDDNLGAADVHLTSDDIAELDAATPLPAVYPNWYIDSLTDQPVNHGLTAGEPTG
ncbi:MAG: aldo/keto reductase [Actinomycetota bacterium]|nr:aldo/keto reductase [Actinomycetota bacterium]